MNALTRALRFAAIASMCAAAVPRIAAACTVSPGELPFEGPPVTVPSEGVLVLPGSSPLRSSVVVETEAGVLVPGEIDETARVLVWRPAQPLDPQTRYRARLVAADAPGGTTFEVFDVVVSDRPAPPLVAPTLGTLRAIERELPTEELCCDFFGDICTEFGYTHCWAQDYAYVTDLVVTWRPTPGDLTQYTFTPGPAKTVVAADGIATTTVRLPDRSTPLCMTIIARDMVHGTTAQDAVCTTFYEWAKRSEPQRPDPAVCTSEIVVRGTGRPPRAEPPPAQPDDEVVDSGGCRASRDGSSGLAALALAAILGVGRRRTLAGAANRRRRPG